MEVFAENITIIEKDIEYLLESILKNNNKKCSYLLYNSLETLIYFYEVLTNDFTKYSRRLEKNKQFCNMYDTKNKKIYNKIIKNFINNREFNNLFSNLIYGSSYEILFEYSNSSNYKKQFDENEIYEIITDFFKKGKQENMILLFEDLIKSKRIFYTDSSILDSNTTGYTIPNMYMNKYCILLTYESSDVKLISSLVHELGHVYDNNLAYGNRDNILYNYLTISPYVEVISSLVEKEFLEFLINEGIDVNQSKNHLTSLYQSIFEYVNNIEILSNLSDRLLTNEKYKKLSNEDFYNVINGIILSNLDEEIETPSYDITTDVRYGYGIAIATYLSALRKKDKDKFLTTFNKFLGARNSYLSPTIFKELGTSISSFSREVKEEITRTNSKVIIKK